MGFQHQKDEAKPMGTWKNCEAVERHSEVVSGVWVFCGTRVPIATLFENLKDGASVQEFLDWFPGVKRSQVEAVLQHEATAAMNLSNS